MLVIKLLSFGQLGGAPNVFSYNMVASDAAEEGPVPGQTGTTTEFSSLVTALELSKVWTRPLPATCQSQKWPAQI
jgi:hypothetical protein